MSVVVAGVGMIPFAKPGRSATYDVMGAEAVRRALQDAGLGYDDVRQAYAGYVYADSAAGQTALYDVGLSGVPVVNVNNYCASGSTALWLARQAVASGATDCAIAVGFEQMAPGAIGAVFDDRPDSLRHFAAVLDRFVEPSDAPPAARYFGDAGTEYARRYDVDPAVFALVAVQARAHAAANPFAVFREPLTVEQVLESPRIHGPLTRLQCCPPTCGAAAVVVCSPGFAAARGIDARVRILAQAMTSDRPDSFDDPMALVGAGLARRGAEAVWAQSGVDPADVTVAEVHDCFTTNQVIAVEALGLAPEGSAEATMRSGATTHGGQVVVNPSGGLLSKGHPLGATGLAQAAELTWQLRGTAGDRQVAGARLALQHNIGLGSACVVTLYERI